MLQTAVATRPDTYLAYKAKLARLGREARLDFDSYRCSPAATWRVGGQELDSVFAACPLPNPPRERGGDRESVPQFSARLNPRSRLTSFAWLRAPVLSKMRLR